MAEVARLGGTIAGGPPLGMEWWVSYDDVTREVTAFAEGAGHLTLILFRSNGQPLPPQSTDPIVGLGPTVVASNVTLRRLTGKVGDSLDGVEHTTSWVR